jgi:5-methylcytosine-specific restriction endonuclease McrA
MKQCFYCGIVTTNPPKLRKKEKFTFPATSLTWDHVVPKCRGGRYLRNNKVPACQGCNIDKGGLTQEEYRVVIAFRNGLVGKPDVLFNAERLENLWPPENE